MTDLYLTWASNVTDENFPEYLVYFKSIPRNSYTEAICLTNSLEDKYRRQIEKTGCRVVTSEAQVDFLLRDRHLAYWQYLCKNPDHDYVLVSDSRDVLFQDDPIFYSRRNLYAKNLVLTSEGFPHRASEFNMVDQFHAQANVQDFGKRYMDWPVVNGGVILGKAPCVRSFCFLVWNTCLRSLGGCTDQAIINYLYSFLRDDPEYFLADPNTCRLSLTGEGVKHGLLDIQPVLINNRLCTPDKEPYCIFHQWERTLFKQQILNHYA